MVCELDQLTDFTAGFGRWQVKTWLLSSGADLFTAFQEGLVAAAQACCCSSWAVWQCAAGGSRAPSSHQHPLPSFLQLSGSLAAFPRTRRVLLTAKGAVWHKAAAPAMSVGLLLLTLQGPPGAFGVSAQEVQQPAC